MIVPAKITDNQKQPDLSGLTTEQQENIKGYQYLPETDEYKVIFSKDYEIEQVRKEAKQRTESVVGKIADIIERKDFQKQGIGKEIADEIRNSNAKK